MILAQRFAPFPGLGFSLPLLALGLFLILALPARAQEQVWVQIEAQPTQAQAIDRAQAYAGVFPETEGYLLRSGWYGIVLGPYGPAEGAAQLAGLRRENLIPRDSFITDGAEFGERFWPTAAPLTPPDPIPDVSAEPLPEVAPEIAPAEPLAEPVAEPLPEPEPDETLQQARRSEAELSDDDRKLLQVALQWYGHYAGAIDGAYGPGTRNSMSAWQESMGLEVTGVLTTRQRATLVANYQAELAEFGFATVDEAAAGIQATLPLNLVAFDRYDPPFAQFTSRDGSGLTILLISEPGDTAALYGLYDILQSLDAVPQAGERSRDEAQFRITGASATQTAHAWARLEGGFIKGWLVLSTPATADRDARILRVLEQSFRAVGDTALDPGLVPLDDTARRGLLAGLEVRKPMFSRSGLYISTDGAVLTTAAAVAQCGRITLDRATDATVTFSDAGLGLAVLTPAKPLSPPGVAAFQTVPDRIGAEVAVAGYSYEDRLPAPVLTWGTLEEVQGLNGEPHLKRLAITALPGDAGGPVVDATGAVLGMLLPPPGDAGSRVLPAGTGFALSSAAIEAALAGAGIALTKAEAAGALPPETLGGIATGMTVLVSCWE